MTGSAPRPNRRDWVRLDNAANIFLAARSEVDTKMFRLSAEIDEEINPDELQRALDRVYAQYPLYRAVIRQGIFWYYLQQSDLQPVVEPDEGPPVSHIYHRDSRDLLFRVLYRGHRISLEVFHALTDGTGAMWFFQDLLTEYVGLRHAEEFDDAAPGPVRQEFAVDAFTHWFRDRPRSASFADDATAAVESPSVRERTAQAGVAQDHPAEGRRKAPRERVLRVRGTRTPDNRTRVVEMSMPVGPVLALARAEGVTLTIYLLALFLDSIRETQVAAGERRRLTCSVPVNLRHYFPTESGRNFFATTRLAHTYGVDEDADSIGAVCRDLSEQFGRVLTREGLERKVGRLVAFERNAALRLVPRPVKDLVLGSISRAQNREITVAITNLGRFTLPDPADSHVGRVYLHVSAVRPQFSAISHGSVLTVSFTSPFVQTGHHAAFARHLTARGVPVEVDVSRVTEDELAFAEFETPGGPT